MPGLKTQHKNNGFVRGSYDHNRCIIMFAGDSLKLVDHLMEPACDLNGRFCRMLTHKFQQSLPTELLAARSHRLFNSVG